MPAGLTWRDVLGDWCGVARGDRLTGVPEPLAEFWAAGGAAALSRQNHFQPPASQDGYSVFYVENQHVCSWAYRSDDPAQDPEVYVQNREAPTSRWVPVGCRLDDFLSAAAVIEIVLGAPIGRAAEGPTRQADVVLGLDRVDLPGLGWPRTVTPAYYRAQGVLAFAQDEDGHSFAFVAAQSAEALRGVDERIQASEHWDFT